MKLPRLSLRHPEKLLGAQGYTIIELLVGVLLVTTVSASLLGGFLNSTKRSYDNQTVDRADEQARSILDLLTFDLRVLGSGMPIGQTGFQIGGAGLGTAPLPVFTDCTASNIHFRLNEHGRDTVLTSDYVPTVANLTFTVFDASDLFDGDTIYLSSMTIGGTSGMQGVITSVVGNTVTVANTYVATAGAIFRKGSTLSRVTSLTYDSAADWSGITRNDGASTIVVAPNSTFTVSYFDSAGTALALPMTETVIKDSLAAIHLTVSVRGDRPLADGSTYTATAQQRVALRNLLLSR